MYKFLYKIIKIPVKINYYKNINSKNPISWSIEVRTTEFHFQNVLIISKKRIICSATLKLIPWYSYQELVYELPDVHLLSFLTDVLQLLLIIKHYQSGV